MTLDVENLTFSYGKKVILQNISFEVEPGELLAVIGPNGVGKSTLFRCILGILNGFTGKVAISQEEVRMLSQRELARRIAYIPQAHQSTFGYSVLETVLMGTTRHLSPFEQPGDAQIRHAINSLKMIDMEEYAGDDYATLSGGQQQLVLIARALAQDAKILIMDEPTSSLDYGNQMKVLHLIKSLSRSGYNVVLSTHNPQHAISFADKVLALAQDRSSCFGSAKQTITAELMNKLYGINVEFLTSENTPILVPKC